MEALRTAVALDPLSTQVRQMLAEVLLMDSPVEEADKVLEGVLAQDPSARSAIEASGWARMMSGDPEAAVALFDRLPGLANKSYAGAASRGYAYTQLGRLYEAREMLALLEDRASDHPEVTMSVDIALVYRGLGDFDAVFHHLNDAVDRRMGGVAMVGHPPYWEGAVLEDPRFEKLLARLGRQTLNAG